LSIGPILCFDKYASIWSSVAILSPRGCLALGSSSLLARVRGRSSLCDLVSPRATTDATTEGDVGRSLWANSLLWGGCS
jgi:hypothetical protein